MNASRGALLATLLGAGLSSALVCALPWITRIELDGLPFAVAITGVLTAFGRIPDIRRGLALLALATLALPTSLRLTLFIWARLSSLPPASPFAGPHSPIAAATLCGYVGQLLVLIGAGIGVGASAAVGSTWGGMRRAIGWSAAGALWGLLAGIVMRNRLDHLWLGFLVWQPLSALTVGGFVTARGSPSDAAARRAA